MYWGAGSTVDFFFCFYYYFAVLFLLRYGTTSRGLGRLSFFFFCSPPTILHSPIDVPDKLAWLLRSWLRRTPHAIAPDGPVATAGFSFSCFSTLVRIAVI
ncbi:hypothetical protein K449DRAFT_95833 [Hypoxylon sp. EC38]|nr:hypothetical protein K449DRAFT_95833 [Hypoxylon sp. EC38]